MMKLWERNDAPPHVDGAPGATGAHPYMVLCHRPAEDAASSVHDEVSGDDDTENDDRDRTAVVYQWVRIPR